MRNGGRQGGVERPIEEGSEYRIFTPSESIRINILQDAGEPTKPSRNEARRCKCVASVAKKVDPSERV